MVGYQNYVWNIFQIGYLPLRPTSLAREYIKGIYLFRGFLLQLNNYTGNRTVDHGLN